MKKLILVLVLFTAMFGVKQVSASNYSVDEQAVDQLFDRAVETSMLSSSSVDMSATSTSLSASISSEKDAMVAVLLNFFVGYLGIHRLYLGTEPIVFVAYLLTAGGCGIVNFVDFIVLLINYDDISAYINNPKFFMWN